ncbi:serine/threonine-protein kinase [Nocardioides dokdonensis]|uniref:serine/threonine-protein kinase n=1 Tax=Nocardioides dokdonensis TaxID=450734 RepID=UPI00147095A7|nr:serine/threonine-protein kinase [Nocardioides dokdonensis]
MSSGQRIPQRLGRYAVRRRIGSGGFATVWLAYDEQLDSPVAVKVLADNWTDDAQVRRRFLEEGRYLRRVESPHVVGVYDAGELDDGRPYLVMSYADQGTLADRLEIDGLSPAQSLEIIRQIGSGLTALHARDILHRDVKPANVLFRTADGEVRAMLGDLGLGKALDVSSRLTMIAGSPSYVAPEQAQAENPDARADQYSLAAVAYLLLAGRPAFSHATLRAAAEPQPVEPIGGDLPPAVDDVVRRALAVDREERWPDVATFVAELGRALEPVVRGAAAPSSAPWLPVDPELTQPGSRPSLHSPSGPLGEPETPQVATQEPRRRRRGLVALGVAAGVLAAAGGAWAGHELEHDLRPDLLRVSDDGGTLSVEVPSDWGSNLADGGWGGPDQDGAYSAVSVGSTPTWTDPGTDGEGVFLGLMPGSGLPELMPDHPECDLAQPPVVEEGAMPSVTVLHTGCPDGLTVERVVQVAGNRLLWVQVRSLDRATANRVLDSVETSGI